MLFLYPEPNKKRWRLVYHPMLFNHWVRLMGLQSVKLPRLRSILKQIDMYDCTVNMDLKCVSFPNSDRKRLFFYRKGSRLFTLKRLPMGSSISVWWPKPFRWLFAWRFFDELKKENVATEGSFNAIVDDIHVSLTIRAPAYGLYNYRVSAVVSQASSRTHWVSLSRWSMFATTGHATPFRKHRG